MIPIPVRSHALKDFAMRAFAPPFFVYCADLCDALIGPFDTVDAANEHIEFCRARGDADPGTVMTSDAVEGLDVDMRMTAAEDRAMPIL